MSFLRSLFLFSFVAVTTQFELSVVAEPNFERQVIDAEISIGYGLAIGDVDGDKKLDVLLADKSQIAWYRNGDWKRFVMAENLNPRIGTRFLDNVCLAARDLDGDGKVEVAVGANWNPGETSDVEKSGSVHYLIRPKDPKARWDSVKMTHEPTVHRMHWIRIADQEFRLLVLPLHGKGNRGGNGEPVRLLAYDPGENPDAGEWKTELVDASMHITHNFDLIRMGEDSKEEAILIGGKEGIKGTRYLEKKGWVTEHMVKNPLSNGVGEVRGHRKADEGMIAAIEPLHGNEVVVYDPPAEGKDEAKRTVLDDSLSQGHALALADLLGQGQLQVIAGWRGANKEKKVGIRIYEKDGDKWKTHTLDDNGIACEDLKIADLNGDGNLDVIAAGRATKNVVVYWNRGAK